MLLPNDIHIVTLRVFTYVRWTEAPPEVDFGTLKISSRFNFSPLDAFLLLEVRWLRGTEARGSTHDRITWDFYLLKMSAYIRMLAWNHTYNIDKNLYFSYSSPSVFCSRDRGQ